MSESSVTLQSYHASDRDVVDAARVSFNKFAEEEWNQRDQGLIEFLLYNKHGSPFEHTYFKWKVHAPIFVIREWQRHRIGWSYNEVSGRYVQLEEKYYAPTPKEVRLQGDGPNKYETTPLTDPRDAAHVSRLIAGASREAFAAYQSLIRQGVAREQARSVLPQGVYTTMIASCNARSLMKFLELRNATDALLEIRELAADMEKIFIETMPVTATIFQSVRVAP